MDDEPQAIDEQAEPASKPPIMQDQPAYQPDMVTRQSQWDLQAERAKLDRIRSLRMAHPDVDELVRRNDASASIIATLSAEVARLKRKCGEADPAPPAPSTPPPTPTESSAEVEETVEHSTKGGDFVIPGHGPRSRNQRK